MNRLIRLLPDKYLKKCGIGLSSRQEIDYSEGALDWKKRSPCRSLAHEPVELAVSKGRVVVRLKSVAVSRIQRATSRTGKNASTSNDPAWVISLLDLARFGWG
ncbi:MAG: hypothetical protein IPJ98_21145 [Bryobacterales bacterium]|nr:hypothetical protein [Bryobacterales bacterium]